MDWDYYRPGTVPYHSIFNLFRKNLPLIISNVNSYLNNTLKVDSNPPKYHSLQESEIPEENVQMKERNYQKEAENVKKVDASSDLVDDWDVDNDYGPDSIGDCYAEYHAYD